MESLKVHVLECGAMGTDIEQLIGSPKYRALAHNHHRERVWASCQLHAVLIEHPGGLILWDTASSREWETEWEGTGLKEVIPYDQVAEEQYLDSRLKQIGFELEQIDTVVLSHLHMDHAGNAKLFDRDGTRFIVNQAELDGAMGFDGFFQGGHIKNDYQHIDFETVTGDVELIPGVKLLEVPGHSFGQMALQVDLPKDGTMIFTSDAVYLEETIEQRHWGSVVWDNRAWLNSLDKILKIRDETDATLVFGHDSGQMTQLRTGAGNYYS
ncbi:N-acyl homoserine lactonase family protein [Leucobacter soli]|uniref:N-acyl homoserine lactonase n=1 Tax=Leucobacter soli TaxID=2812850 RepID=A0A916NPE8_9MICO|nr:N-acyl homoserine lactonase family protein [Leucobacter soli]CAG7619474.1 N-acyl homoserine lactonase [Leucobacter soli]